MTRFALIALLFLSLSLTACGRKGTPDFPEGDPDYPRSYPSPEAKK